MGSGSAGWWTAMSGPDAVTMTLPKMATARVDTGRFSGCPTGGAVGQPPYPHAVAAQAETVARSIPDPDWQAQALVAVASALAARETRDRRVT